MKLRSCLFVFIRCIVFCLVILSIYIYFDSRKVDERLYYIPQAQLYVKTIYSPQVDKEYNYVLFSRDSSMTWSEDIDYIKVKRRFGVSFIVDVNSKKDIYVADLFKKIDIHQVDYRISKININTYARDSTFFKNTNKPRTEILKSPYIEVFIMEYFSPAFLKLSEDSTFTELKPIN